MTLQIVLTSAVTTVFGGLGLLEGWARRGVPIHPDATDRVWPVALLLVFSAVLSNFAIWLPQAPTHCR